ncbi:MAG: signal peptidase II [Oscillospiraceae bacterium]|nr:signal peptidase II [Oscillospiraceae bacterium]
MQFLYMTLFAGLIVAADQYTKYLTVQQIALHGSQEFIPGFLSLTYTKNYGAAFSSFQGMQWLFAVIFVIFTGAVLYEYFKKPMPFRKAERWCIAAIYGGGLGNMIDRVRLGYVVDMIKTEFMTFPIFNVADCFITCGCFLLIALLFFNKEFWKEEKKHDLEG